MKPSTAAFAVVGTVIAMAGFSPSAHAIQKSRKDMIHAQGACQPAVPTQGIRVFATGLRNVSGSSIYVTCATFGQWFEDINGSNLVEVGVANLNGSARTMQCTLNTGWAFSTTAGVTSQGTFPKSVAVAANSTGRFSWYSPAVLGVGRYFANASFTCLLPSSTEIKWLVRNYDEDVGA